MWDNDTWLVCACVDEVLRSLNLVQFVEEIDFKCWITFIILVFIRDVEDIGLITDGDLNEILIVDNLVIYPLVHR